MNANTNAQRPGSTLTRFGLLLIGIGVLLAVVTIAAGGNAVLYHLDARDPDQAKARPLNEEIARVVHARAANPAWVDGMMRHGFRGGAEIAATVRDADPEETRIVLGFLQRMTAAAASANGRLQAR